MAPPSPRDRRRSTASSKRLTSSSHSAKSDSPDPQLPKHAPPQLKMPTALPNGRSKRPPPKQDNDDDHSPADSPKSSLQNGTTTPHTNGRTKRKGKDKDKDKLSSDIALDAIVRAAADDDIAMDLAEPEQEEEQGVTRCICGRAEEADEDAGEFMVQCEICKVWQHGMCMGFDSEDDLPPGDYFCELCKPEFHTDRLKSITAPHSRSRRRPNHVATPETPQPNASRASRSHSPTHLKPAKRRNTMNSRDAAYDVSLQEILTVSAAEAGVHPPTPSVSGSVNGAAEDDPPATDNTATAVNGRKKRKRTEDDPPPPPPVNKRTRSASTASDRPQPPTAPPREREDTPASVTAPKPTASMPAPPPPPPKNNRNRRGGGGGRKSAAQQQQQQQAQDAATADGDEASMPPPPSNRRSNQSRNKSGNKRGGAGDNTRSRAAAANAAPATRRDRDGYDAGPLTTWGLPDHLAHLEPMFPTDVPQALDVPDGGTERASERGVKIKWPAKRMSVGDMNKRVRSLVEWVGREQASLLERGRRQSAVTAALRDAGVTPDANGEEKDGAGTMRLMEELMEELIGFQEKFGPGAKSKDRARVVS